MSMKKKIEAKEWLGKGKEPSVVTAPVSTENRNDPLR